jgi:carotenoid 1,2-hydratase
VRDDVWHPDKLPRAYEWWYFDAISDDGTEAVVVTFLDNFVYSPRYNAKDGPEPRRFPAVSVTYFSKGRPVYRSVSEFSEEAFEAGTEHPRARIGSSSFEFQEAEYGLGYVVNVDCPLSSGRRMRGSFEWLSVEADLQPDSFRFEPSMHSLNMVAPRSDVTGRLNVFDRHGRETDVRHFRGTGYHDHNLDNRWLAKTVRDWHWGRAHFADATAIFYRYCEVDEQTPGTKLFIVRSGELQDRAVDYDEQNYARDRHGIRYPTRLRLISQDNVRLRVKPLVVVESSFYFLRFLAEFTLTLRDGVPRKTTGITEFIAPRTLRYRWLNWLNDLGVKKAAKERP